MNISKTFVGLAGEYLVLSRLTSKGLLASLAPRNNESVDIFTSNPKTAKSHLIQVKTRLNGPKESGWHVSPEDRNASDSKLFYCFVDLQSKPERVYVIPSRVVSSVLQEAHKSQMKKPMRDGSKRTSHNYAKLKNNYRVKVKAAPNGWMDKYLEKWDLITK